MPDARSLKLKVENCKDFSWIESNFKSRSNFIHEKSF